MKAKLFIISSLLFTVVWAAGRFLLLRESRLLQFNMDLLAAVGADLFFAAFIIALVYVSKKVNRVIPYVITLPLMLLFLSNMEYIYALGDVINLRDMFYAADTRFVQGTLSHLSFPVYSVLLLASLIFLIVSVDRRRIVFRSYRATLRQLILYGVVLLTAETGFIFLMGNNWERVSLVQASLHNGMNDLFYRDEIVFADFPGDIDSQIYGVSHINDGTALLPPASDHPKNILVVAMEGIPGAYLQGNQQYFATDHKIQLTSLERIKDHTLAVPNFLTHNNQTIRGLYSLLSGGYPKLDASTPDAYEYIQNPQSVSMLPQELKARGYQTAFIQAAPLDYMSKDQFMSTAGFDTIIGSEGFQSSISFGWGIDDGAFFDQVPAYLEELDQGEAPWFATLLTVGTHHPYALPPEFEQRYPDRKEAAVRYLDESLAKFIDYLQASDVGKDTLVIFTSDESHGVTGQPYGSNWGLCLVYSPSIAGEIVNEGIYGLKDLKGSILDYVDQERESEDLGRSIFRAYNTEEPILFASHYSGDVFYLADKGEVFQLDSRNRLYAIHSANGQLFSQNYTRTRISDNTMQLSLTMYKQYLNQPLIDPYQELVIISDKQYEAGWGEYFSITGGQYLTLPARSYVTITMDYEFIEPTDGDEITFYLDAEQNQERLGRKTVDSSMPGQGKLVYTFYNEEERGSYNFTLRASLFAESGRLRVNRLSVDFPAELPEKDPAASEFEIYSEM
ncbi:MAG: hypothetical protein K0R57_3802 [Paenibacillaceae bacterium]|jgi:hypothetical protein|nr:hypothetical protein [Paenibacillaceae bacterium]